MQKIPDESTLKETEVLVVQGSGRNARTLRIDDRETDDGLSYLQLADHLDQEDDFTLVELHKALEVRLKRDDGVDLLLDWYLVEKSPEKLKI